MTATLRRIETAAAPHPDNFGSAAFLPASDVTTLADQLIDEEDRFEFLGQVKITYLWKAKGGTRSGKDRLGQTQIATGLVGHFSQADVVIWLAADHLYGKPADFVEAVLFHELCHVWWDEEQGLSLLAHDFEGFAAELNRYGLWKGDARAIAPAFRQAQLFEEGKDR